MSKSTIDNSVSYSVALEKLKVFPKEISTTLKNALVCCISMEQDGHMMIIVKLAKRQHVIKVSKRHSHKIHTRHWEKRLKIRQTNKKKKWCDMKCYKRLMRRGSIRSRVVSSVRSQQVDAAYKPSLSSSQSKPAFFTKQLSNLWNHTSVFLKILICEIL